MQQGKIMGGLLKICDLIMKLAYLNLLWIAGTAAGLILFGFMPATVALFNVIRERFLHDEAVMWQTYIRTYKAEFFKSNGLGLLLLTVGYVLYINFQFVTALQEFNSFSVSVMSVNVLIAVLLGMVLLFIFPVYVHCDMTMFNKLKLAVLLGVTSPHITLSLIIILALFVLLFMFIPGLIFFFSLSAVAFCMMGICLKKMTVLNEKVEG